MFKTIFSADGQPGSNDWESSSGEDWCGNDDGDYNCNMLCPDSKAVRLAMVTSEYGLVQMIKGPTRVTESSETQIDMLFVTNTDLVDQVECEETGLSA